jgi:hypothetical protein
VLGDFDWKQLVLTDVKFGKMIAGIRSINYPSSPTERAVDSDILDLAIIEFDAALGASFFRGAAYALEPGTYGTASIGDDLVVNGLLKEHTTIDERDISPTFGLIEFTERGPASFDLALRHAEGLYVRPQFSSLTGFSGAPVFDVTSGLLSGMVVRATMPSPERALMYYIDVIDMLESLKAVANGTLQANYKKTVAIPVAQGMPPNA